MKVVILAGGGGTRLYPLSTEECPKQFLRLYSRFSLLQETVLRLLPLSKKPIIVSNGRYAELVKRHMNELEIKNFLLVEEPARRNTAPAIALAIKYLLDKVGVDEKEAIGVFPSDHYVGNSEKLLKALRKSELIAKEGYIVTFDIKPTRPDTGYGYIESGDRIETSVYRVKRFHEKPSKEKAIEYIKSRKFFWNSGMFVFSIKTILEEFKAYQLFIYESIVGKDYNKFLEDFSHMPNISLDYAVMEKTKRGVVLPLELAWSDLGCWESVYEILKKEDSGNVKVGDVVFLDTKNSMGFSTKKKIIFVGVENIVAVEAEDVVLIMNFGNGQKIKLLNEMDL